LKKKIVCMIVCILFLSTIVGTISSTTKSTIILNEMPSGMSYTHTVFLEVATSQNCKPCHYWNQNINQVYNSGSYDFEYVEMIEFDHEGEVLNEEVKDWSNIYYIGSYPTSIFDGDYRRLVGDHPEQLSEKLDACGNRIVKDLTANMTVSWLGDAKINVDITIQNNEGTQYNGYIRACITEIISRYDTYYNEPYHFGFIGYAFPMNTAISIPAGSTYTNSVIWDGNEHQDNHGDDFGDITPSNIKVYLGVFNNANDYVDEAVMALITSNNPPNEPSSPSPTDGATDVDIDADLSWTCSDPDSDTLSYDVYFGNVSDPPLIASDIALTSYDLGLMNVEETYFWKIVAEDSFGASTEGPIWSFTTGLNDPPYVPSNPDPSDGATGVGINADISWSGGDPNPGDTVTYDIYFGTISPPPLLVTNHPNTNYNPGTMVFNTKYYWEIVAEDNYGENSTGPIWSFTTISNNPPNPPSNPNPSNGTSDIDIDAGLSWTCIDPDGDTLHYTVYFGDASPPPEVASNIQVNTYNPGAMNYNTKYYWKIVAWDENGASTSSPIWSFTTEQLDTKAPNVKITKPKFGLYLFNIKILPRIFRITKVIGTITIEANSTDADSGIEKVEFYINGIFVGNDTSEPYTFNWNWIRPRLFHLFIIKAIAYDNAGNTDVNRVIIRKYL